MGRSTVHYADNETNNILKRLHNKLRPAGTPVERVEYIIELLLLRIFETKLKHDETFAPLRKLFDGENYRLLFSYLLSLTGDQILSEFKNIFPFYATILIKSRSVINTNLPIKIYDQLVLMEEVFANSNFTNNVKGGVAAEVIGLVNEIDEKYILKTDLLGDAIESALSETGGTKDLGLYRTPDHIRKMMVEMVEPNFNDTIFDPACGTAGFLFNAWEYAIEKAKVTRQIPTENIANQFYRTGIGGIEYQGRIRKMAAVNLYIRGLNPHNIEQGDSLKMYDPSQDENSKSIIISNPPFGAERDQPAYPNVWEEYSKESETTILFVKLMFNLLKKGGICAVVVSEGFLTWGQNSACALRKILLNETNLKAIISLPQGVFVSKSGQGAKTSILYFEKGQPTDFVWYYKIENDGFSMGTNRKPIEGSQIPGMLTFFKEVKNGNKPKDTKYSFCIPKEWMETIDPRFIENIKNEVTEKFIKRNKQKKEKIFDELDKKLAEGKINNEHYEQKQWYLDNVAESQIENEVTKAIEKAHTYHFNLQNYKSNLSEEQINEWNETLQDIKPIEGLSIQKQYQELKVAKLEKVLQIIKSIDPKNALSVDIVREYINKQISIANGDVLIKGIKTLKLLNAILEKGFKYPNIQLRELLTPRYEKIKKDDYKSDFDIIDKITFNDGVIHLRDVRTTGMDLCRAYQGDLITSKINVHQGAVAVSPDELVCSTHYQVYNVHCTRINPTYLVFLLRSQKFIETLNLEKAGGIKNEIGADFLLSFKISLPPIEIQDEIVKTIKKQKQVIDSAEIIVKAVNTINIPFDQIVEIITIREIINRSEAQFIQRGKSPQYDENSNLFILNQKCNRGYKIDFSFAKGVQKEWIESINKNIFTKEGDILINSTGEGTVGRAVYIQKQYTGYLYDSHLLLLRLDPQIINPAFVCYFLNSNYGQKQIMERLGALATKQVELGVNNLESIKISLPSLEIQQKIVEKLDKQFKANEYVKFLKSEAEKRIQEILLEVWGEN